MHSEIQTRVPPVRFPADFHFRGAVRPARHLQTVTGLQGNCRECAGGSFAPRGGWSHNCVAQQISPKSGKKVVFIWLFLNGLRRKGCRGARGGLETSKPNAIFSDFHPKTRLRKNGYRTPKPDPIWPQSHSASTTFCRSNEKSQG